MHAKTTFPAQTFMRYVGASSVMTSGEGILKRGKTFFFDLLQYVQHEDYIYIGKLPTSSENELDPKEKEAKNDVRNIAQMRSCNFNKT